MEFHAELIKITEFPSLDEYLVKKKNSELVKISQSDRITVAIRPSNLTELTRLGERYAPDSCVVSNDFKYVLAQDLIPNTLVNTHLHRDQEEIQPFTQLPNRAKVVSIIPGLIVRERPGISYKPIKETSFNSTGFEHFVPDAKGSENNYDSIDNTVEKPKSFKKKIEKSPIRVPTAQTSKSKPDPKTLEDSPKKTLKIPSKKISKKSKKIKTILRKKPVSNNEDYFNTSMSDRKTVTWDESGKQEKDEEVMRQHETKRKEHLEKYKYQYPSYLKEKDSKIHQDSLSQLEKIVEEEKEFLHDKGIYTPGSSQASKYQKTYEELEKEIRNIKEMLNEDQKEKNNESDEENESIDYSYSSDKAENDDDKWMKPRFKSS